MPIELLEEPVGLLASASCCGESRGRLVSSDDDDFEEDEEIIEHQGLPVEDEFDEEDFDDDFDDDFEEDSDDAEEGELSGDREPKIEVHDTPDEEELDSEEEDF